MARPLESPFIEKGLRIPRNKWVVRATSIRGMHNDKPELNEIYDSFNSNIEIEICILRALKRYNEQSPFDSFNITNFPFPYWLQQAALYELLMGVGLFKAQNLLTGSNQGIEVSIHANIQALQPFITMLYELTDRELKSKKRAKNISGGYGPIHASIPGFYPGIMR